MDGFEGVGAAELRRGAVERLAAAVGGKTYRGEVAQHGNAVEQRMAMGGDMLAAPLPGLDLRSLAARDAVERSVERCGDRVVAAFRRGGGRVVAPLRPLAQDAHQQRQ